jgi:hypothetical protein
VLPISIKKSDVGEFKRKALKRGVAATSTNGIRKNSVFKRREEAEYVNARTFFLLLFYDGPYHQVVICNIWLFFVRVKR